MRPAWRASEEMKSAAKELRREPTTAERALWEILRSFRDEGFPFRRQVPKGRFVLDFYCPTARLAVEAYGGIHDFESVARRDAEREHILKEAYQIDILYLSNEQILKDPIATRALVASALKKAQSVPCKAVEDNATSPSPASAGEGCPKGGVRVHDLTD